MSAAVRNRSPARHPSGSPRRRRSPPRKDRSPDFRRTSSRAKSPVRTSASHRSRSPADVGHPKAGRRRQSRSPIRDRPPPPPRPRSPVRARSRSPMDSSPSPSPRTKRLRRVQANREEGKQLGNDHTRERDAASGFARERPLPRTRSPIRARSRSPTDSSPSPSPRTKRLKRAQANRDERKQSGNDHTRERDAASGFARERPPPRTRSPVRARSRSPTDSSPSPSPRTKRLRRAQANRDEGNQLGSDHARERDGASGFARDKVEGRHAKPARHAPSVSPSERDRQHRRRSSGSPPRASRDRAREEVNGGRGAERSRDYGDDSVSKMKAAEEALEAKQKQKPSFELSGKLAEETNRVRGVALLFTEPPDARKPDVRWRLYVFKAGEVLNEPLYLHRQSSYLFGRERRVADVPTDHPSCSKQHAVIQYRLVEKEQPDGLMKKQVRPYLMDLGSTNGTFINDNRIEAQRYYELFEKDTIKFGNSSREYVLLHENSVQ